MFKAIALLLLATALAWATDHQGAIDDKKDGDAVEPNGSGATILLESTRKGRGDGDGDGKSGPRGAGESEKDKNRVRITGYPLFIFAEGPPAAGAAVTAETQSRTKQMIADLQRKIPGARVEVVSPYSAEALAEVWRNARRTKKTDTSLITTSLLILQARAGNADGLGLMGAKGLETEAQWRHAIESLSESIYGGLPRIAGGGKLETVLLVGNAGVLDCKKFPGPVFGGSRAADAFDDQAFHFWIKWQQDHRQDLFPTSARDWFDSYNITDKISRRRYFYCPDPSPRGYLGNKNPDDEKRGGW